MALFLLICIAYPFIMWPIFGAQAVHKFIKDFRAGR